MYNQNKTKSFINNLKAGTSLGVLGLLSLSSAGNAQAIPTLAADQTPVVDMVTGGDVDFNSPVAGRLNAVNNEALSSVDFDSFGIGQDATFEIFQQSNNSTFVVNVTGSEDVAVILGNLYSTLQGGLTNAQALASVGAAQSGTAGGNVLINADSVIVGPTGNINVGAIVATSAQTINLDTFDVDGLIQLSDFGGDGLILNEGTITVADGGLAAFVAPTVINRGVITARTGRVDLGAGGTMATIDLYGDGLLEIGVDPAFTDVLIENTGTIDAENGVVALTARAASTIIDNVINTTGVVKVASATLDGGKIVLDAGTTNNVSVAGNLDAVGTNGGEVNVAGNDVTIADTANLRVNARSNDGGNGGSVTVDAEGDLDVQGNIFANGSGDGDTVGGDVTLTAENITLDSQIDLRARKEENVDGTLTLNVATLNVGDTDGVNQLSAETVADQLGLGNLALNTTGTLTFDGAGDINLETFSVERINFTRTSTETLSGTTQNSLAISAATLNILSDVRLGEGDFHVDAMNFALGAVVFGLENGTSTALTSLGASSDVDLVTVLNGGASIDQAIDFVNVGGTVDIDAGTYGAITVDKSITLTGANAGTNGASDMRVAETTIQAGLFGAAINVQADDVTVDGFEITGGVFGVATESSGTTITNNKISNTTGSGVGAALGSNISITNNEITGTRSGDGILATSVSGLTITGNTIEEIDGDGVDVASSSDVTISNNMIDEVEQDGLALRDLTGTTTISGNTITDAETGIDLDGVETFSISGNTLNELSEDGIYIDEKIDGTTNTLSNNTVTADERGIVFNDGFENANLTAAGNTVTSGGVALFVGSASPSVNGGILSFTGSNFTSTSGDAVVFEDEITGAAQVTFTGGSATSTTGNGFAFNQINGNSLVTLDGVNVDANTNAVQVTGGLDNTLTTFTVQNSTLSATNGAGIVIADTNPGNTGGVDLSSQVNIIGNFIGSEAGDVIGTNGIEFSDSITRFSNVVISGNEIGQNGGSVGGSGIVVQSDGSSTGSGRVTGSATLDVQGNTIYATSDGVQIAEDVDGARVTIGGAGTDANTINAGRDGVAFGGDILDASDIDVTNNTINAGANGITIDGELSGGVDLDIVENRIAATTGDAISIRDDRRGGVDADILNNIITSAGDDGIEISRLDGATIQGSDIDNVTNAGINVANSSDVVIGSDTDSMLGNSVTTATQGIVLDDADRALVGYNVIDSIANATAPQVDGIRAVRSSDLTITENMISNVTGGDGIDLGFQNTGAMITNNTITNVGAEGIRIVNQSTGATVTGNSVDGADRGIFTASSAGATIDNNTVNDTSRQGIDASTGTLSVSGNTVTNAGNHGIEVDNSTGVLVQNNFVGTNAAGDDFGADNITRHGINIFQSNDAQVTGNTVTETTENGIFVNASTGTLTSANTISETGENGIRTFAATNAEVFGNTITNAGTNGISIEGTDGATVSQANRITGTGANGILVGNGSGTTTVDGNFVLNTGDNGIIINGADGSTVSFNEVDNAGTNGDVENNDGIHVRNTSGINVNNNFVNTTDGDGIHVQDSSLGTIGLTVQNNEIGLDGGAISGDGIRVTNSAGTFVQANSVADTGANGIAIVDSANSTVNLNNEIDGTGSAGIAVNRSGGSTVDGNDIDNTGGSGVWVNLSDGTTVSANDIDTTGLNTSRGTNDGVYVQRSSNVTVGGDTDAAGNTIANTAGNGVFVTGGTGNSVQFNNVISATENGVQVDGSEGIQVLDNNIGTITFGSPFLTGVGQNGVLVENSNGANISDNDVFFSQLNGILVSSSNGVTIDDNTVGLSGLDGIQLAGATTGVNEVTDNIVFLSGDDGIDLNGSNGLAEDNLIIASAGNGLEATDSTDFDGTDNLIFLSGVGLNVAGVNDLLSTGFTTTTFPDVLFELATRTLSVDVEQGNGIYVGNSSGADLTGNIIGLSVQNGVFFDTTDTVTATGNNIFLTGNDGISARGSGTTTGSLNISGNFLTLLGGDGIDVANHTDVTVSNNDILAAGLDLADLASAYDAVEAGDIVSVFQGVNPFANVTLDTDGIDYAWGNGSGISITNAQGETTQVTGNTIRLTGGNGIEVIDSGSANIDNNTVSFAGIESTFFSFDDLSDHFSNLNLGDLFSVTNAVEAVELLIPFPTDGELGEGNGIYLTGTDNSAITSNNVSFVGENGIYNDGSNSTNIQLNTINFAGEDGVRVNPSNDVVVDQNTIFNVNGNGIIAVGGNNFTATANTIADTGENGIYVEDTTGLVTISNNFIGTDNLGANFGDENIGEDGIFTDNTSTLIISGNTIADTDDDGIKVESALDSVTITDNFVGTTAAADNKGDDNIGDDGIDVEDVALGVTISGNTVVDTENSGIEVSRVTGDTSITGNFVGTNAASGFFGIGNIDEEGISVTDSGNVVIQSNTVTLASGDGIIVTDSNTVLIGDANDDALGNTVTNVGGDGIEVSGTIQTSAGDTRIARNTVQDAVEAGIEVSGITNGRIDDNSVDETGETGIFVTGSDRTRVRNNTVSDTTFSGIAVLDSDRARVNDNIVSDTGFNGILLNNVNSGRANRNTVSDTGFNGIFVLNSTGNVRVRNNFVGTDSLGTDLGGDNVSADGINLTNVETVTLTGNTVVDTGLDGVEIDGATGTVEVADNFIGTNAAGTDFGGDNIDNQGFNIDNVGSLTFSGNTVVDTGLDGVNINGVTGSTIIADNFVGTNAAGTQFGGFNIDNEGFNIDNVANITVSGNTVVETGDEGIQIDSATGSVVIIDNFIGTNAAGTDFGTDNVNEEGIEIGTLGSTLVFTGNTIVDTGLDGVEIDNVTGDASISNNFIGTNAAGDDFGAGNIDNEGIDINGVTGALILENNIVTDAGGTGLLAINTGSVTITDGSYSNNNNDGILLDTVGDVTLTNVTADNNVQESGLDIDGATSLTVTGGSFSGNGNGIGDHGLDIDSITGSVSVSDVTANDNADSGLSVNGASDLVVTNGTFNLNSGDGIDVDSVADVTLTNVTTDGNTGNGASVDGATTQLTVTDATLTGNGLNGLLVEDAATITVTGGTFNGNGTNATGLDAENNGLAFIDVTGLEITDVTASDNVNGAGLFIDPSSGITVTGSTFDGNLNGAVIQETTDLTFDTNSFSGNADTGITLEGVDVVTLLNNTIEGNDTGLLATVFTDPTSRIPLQTENGVIVLDGNTFTDNTSTGARLESGEFDLTSATPNTFTGGVNGVELSPFELENGDEAALSLTGDTLGVTTFTGQTGLFVELTNGALFDEVLGTPTTVDATLATFNGVSAGPDGFLTTAELAAIEAQLQDFDDDPTVGDIFVGAVSPFDDFEEIQQFFDPEAQTTGLSLTITGPVATSQAALLNALTPAAGGNDDGSDLQDIEPAAGEGEQVGCFSDLSTSTGVATFSFVDGNDFTARGAQLGDIANCGQ